MNNNNNNTTTNNNNNINNNNNNNTNNNNINNISSINNLILTKLLRYVSGINNRNNNSIEINLVLVNKNFQILRKVSDICKQFAENHSLNYICYTSRMQEGDITEQQPTNKIYKKAE